jgi:hypothetical protein
MYGTYGLLMKCDKFKDPVNNPQGNWYVDPQQEKPLPFSVLDNMCVTSECRFGFGLEL